MRFCEKSSIHSDVLKMTADDMPRLKFAPPRNVISYG
jgi:hypothetical protein